MAEVFEGELLYTLHSFQRDKSPRPNGWPIKFYLGFFDFMGKDLHKVVEESRVEGFIHGPFNTTFLALIPKEEQPLSFEEFRPISLGNYIYKIISKIIAIRFKAMLSKNISYDQFGFLEGKQIHESMGFSQEGLHNLKG